LKYSLNSAKSLYGDAISSAIVAMTSRVRDANPVENANEIFTFRESIAKQLPPQHRSWRLMKDWNVYIRNAPLPHVTQGGVNRLTAYPSHEGMFGFGKSDTNYLQDVLDAASTITSIHNNLATSSTEYLEIESSPEYINLMFSKLSRLLREAVVVNAKLKESWSNSMLELSRVS
jgi:hypothetical protein